MTKDEFIQALRLSTSYKHTHRAIENLNPNITWSDEEIRNLCYIAMNYDQVYDTLSYKKYPKTGEFYKRLLDGYRGPKTSNIKAVEELVYVIDNRLIYNFLVRQRPFMLDYSGGRVWHNEEYDMDITVCDGLYHANSVSTAISYIQNKKIYSRQYGDEYFEDVQTPQWSDETDIRDGIYNDLFFDNCDIRSITGCHSAYGPVTFVMDEKILLNLCDDIRITKMNPANVDDFGSLDIRERYFTSIEELWGSIRDSQYLFRSNFGFHTTIHNKKYIELRKDSLKYILIERNEEIEKSISIKTAIENALANSNLNNIPVIIRDNLPNVTDVAMAAPIETLWNL